MSGRDPSPPAPRGGCAQPADFCAFEGVGTAFAVAAQIEDDRATFLPLTRGAVRWQIMGMACNPQLSRDTYPKCLVA